MKSKTLIEKQTRKKTNSNLIDIVKIAKKQDGWREVAEILTGSRRNRIEINLGELFSGAKDGETIVVPGKILSQGEVNKKIKIVSFSFSKNAREKLLNGGCDVVEIIDEIKNNPNAEGIRIIKK